MLRRVFPHLLDLIAPPACGMCGTWLVAPESAVCAACAAELPPGGAEIAHGALAGIATATRYTGLVRGAIRALKFGHEPWRAGPLGVLVAHEAAQRVPVVDAVVPIPLPSDRLRERGYNQAALLARVVGRQLGRPVVFGAAGRRSGGPPQSGRSAAEREGIAEEWTPRSPRGIAGRRILVVDDVITTGATIRSFGALLGSLGATEVYAAAVAWTPSPADPGAVSAGPTAPTVAT